MDILYHYPPELFRLLIDTIPKLCKSKKDLILFFRGAGVSKSLLSPYEDMLLTGSGSFNKYHVTRELLTVLNEQGEQSLSVRRQLLKRVTEFEDYTLCWENDRLQARGLVAQIRDIVNVKDSFTRMRIEKDEEKRKHLDLQKTAITLKQKQSARIQNVKRDLFLLFREQNARVRGKCLEKVLNELFDCFDVLVSESFTIRGNCGEGIIEQIDGLVEFEGQFYLVEMKWWNTTIGVGDVAPHLVRVFNRGGQARGLFISYTDFSDAAINQCREALSGGAVVMLATLQEIVNLLEEERDLKKWLKTKITAAIVDKQPYKLVM